MDFESLGVDTLVPNFRSRRESAEENVPDPGHCWQAGGSIPSVPQRARGAG